MAYHVRGDGHDFFVLGYYPSRVSLTFNGIDNWIVLDQIGTVDAIRLVKKLGSIGKKRN